MLLEFKTKLKLNNSQRTQMAKHAGVARHGKRVSKPPRFKKKGRGLDSFSLDRELVLSDGT